MRHGTSPECEEIIAALGGLDKTIEAVGNGVPAGFTASKILWLKKHEPENYARLRSVLLPHDYINFWLTGRKTMECGDASGTALLDVRSRKWSQAAIDAIDPRLVEMLPPLIASDEIAGTLRPELAAEFGLGDGVIVSSGGGDNMMGAIGTGNVRAGVVTVSLGTSGTIYACSEHPVVDPHGEIAAFCDSTGRWLPLVCTMNVTVATEMVRERFNLSHDEMSQAASAVPAGNDGLMLIPFFEGERTPNVARRNRRLLRAARQDFFDRTFRARGDGRRDARIELRVEPPARTRHSAARDSRHGRRVEERRLATDTGRRLQRRGRLRRE